MVMSVCVCGVRGLHPAAKKLAAAAACLVYMAISSALIVLNQQLMNEDGFRYPMALSGLGMGFSAVASYMACKVSSWHFTACRLLQGTEAAAIKLKGVDFSLPKMQHASNFLELR